MFTNFLKTTVRNMLRNRAYVIINIIGLGLSLACCIVGYLNFKYAADFDKNHENHASIYKIQINKTVQGRNIPYGISPLPLGHEIKNDLAGVSQVVRYTSSGMVMQQGEKILNKRIGFADEDLFEMFTFPFKYGDKSSFLNPGNLIRFGGQGIVYRFEPGNAIGVSEGEELDMDELAGLALFESKCSSCHSGALFTDQSYRNNGLDEVFDDRGRATITELATDEGKFKVPSLRNVAITDPYMHDGRFFTLEQVLDHYSEGVVESSTLDPSLSGSQLGIPLTDLEKNQIIAFLNTLTSSSVITEVPEREE